jgi:hypothetical protein
MKLTSRYLVACLLSSIVLLPGASTVQADAASILKCQRTINKELAKFVKTKSRILQKCKESAVKRLDPTSPVLCPLEAQDDKINVAAQRMQDKIAAVCGGANKICNALDVGENADEPLADIGWDIGTCPDLRGEGCTNAISDCSGIGICLACIGHDAVNQASELSYDLLTATEFGTGSDLNDCQVAIGKASVKYLQAKSTALKTCWDNVLRGKAGFNSPPGCPATDPSVPNKTLEKLAKAEQKKIDTICTACGAGGDADKNNVCDDPLSAFSPSVIGFEPECPDATVPGAPASCKLTIGTLADLITCVDCLTDFEVQCTTDIPVPTLTTYPAECSAVP